MFDYLKDISFLSQLDNYKMRVQYVKIILLSFDEKPIKEISGVIQSGNLNINGSAAIRRTINLSMAIPLDKYFNINDLDNDISLNKKIKIFVGYQNPLLEEKKYTNYPILWFPCGLFVISSASISKSINSCTISIQGKDKMVLLDGSVGGKLPAPVIFHEIYENDDNGKPIIKYPTIFQIIQEAVQHWGEEKPGNILINDLDDTIKLLVKYNGLTPIYFSKNYNSFSTIQNSSQYPNLCKKGQDIGFKPTPFTYPGELILNAGESVVSLLTKICNVLGNYEFFYDLEGRFIFQEKKNYLNVQKVNDLRDLTLDDYCITYNIHKEKYNFKNDKTISKINKNPKYDNIKNDFIVWGKRQIGDNKKEIPIRYHLVIESKPEIKLAKNNLYTRIFCSSNNGNKKIEIINNMNEEKNLRKWQLWVSNEPKERRELIYHNEKNSDSSFWTYNFKKISLSEDLGIQIIDESVKPSVLANFKDGDKLSFYFGYEAIKQCQKFGQDVTREEAYIETLNEENKSFYVQIGQACNEWREELYRLALKNNVVNDKYSIYYAEILAEWRKIYNSLLIDDNIINNEWKVKDASNLDFWIDFIDNNNILDKYSVQNIGRRLEVVKDDKIFSLFNKEPLDIMFINREDKNTYKNLFPSSKFFYLTPQTYDLFTTSSTYKSAFDKIRELLYIHLSYNTQITITCLPKYYLEPNSIFYIEDKNSGIMGNYFISQISLPLTYNGMMNITATEILTRI